MRLLYEVVSGGCLINIGNEHIDAYEYTQYQSKGTKVSELEEGDLIPTTLDARTVVSRMIEDYTNREDCIPGLYVFMVKIFSDDHLGKGKISLHVDVEANFNTAKEVLDYVQKSPDFVSNKFYLFDNPYFALITAPCLDEAKEIHRENVTDEIVEPREISSNEAYDMYIKCAHQDELNTKAQDDIDFRVSFQRSTVLLIDSELL